VVDDVVHSGFLLTGHLMSAGYQVTTARDAESALTSGRAQPPHLAVICLDSASGANADLVRICAHDPQMRKTAMLIVSPDPSVHEVDLPANADFLAMPVELGRFLETCARLVHEAGRADANRILVVDDDSTIRLIVRDVLEQAGYEVYDVGDGMTALEVAKRFKPHVMLLDIMMPKMDGFETAERLRADPATSMTPIIFVSAKGETADKVRAFKAGAEDYMVKPFDTEELVARVAKSVARQARELGASPTTQLPGSDIIESAIEARLRDGQNHAFCYLDLDNLKAFNDYYGYAKADGIIRQTGDIIRDVVAREGAPGDFIGHIAGDDFVFITKADRVDAVCAAICSTFDRLVPLYYDRADRARGFIETKDRYGVFRQFPIMTVSIAVVTPAKGEVKRFSELAALAARGKKLAKALVGSSFVWDDRTILGTPVPDADT
jgi:DNA-binding response OmpR family regulator